MFFRQYRPLISSVVWDALEATWLYRSELEWNSDIDRSSQYLMCNSTIISSNAVDNGLRQSFACPLYRKGNCRGNDKRCCNGLYEQWSSYVKRGDFNSAIQIAEQIYNLIINEREQYELKAMSWGNIYRKALGFGPSVESSEIRDSNEKMGQGCNPSQKGSVTALVN